MVADAMKDVHAGLLTLARLKVDECRSGYSMPLV